MTHSRMLCIGGVLALLALAPLDCRQAIPQKTTRPPEKSANSSHARDREFAVADQEATPKSSGDSPDDLRANEVTDVDKNDTSGNSANLSNASKPPERPWEAARRIETERIQRERRARARADWEVALRTDTPEIVPCQPLYLTIKVTNTTDQPRKVRDLFQGSQFWIFVGRSGEEPQVVKKLSVERDVEQTNLFIVYLETAVAERASVFFDRMLTLEKIDGRHSNNPAPPRIFSEPGEYKVYAAVVDPSKPFVVLRSEPLAVMVREPTESEVPYVEFFREGRQIPPHYGFSKANEEAFDKLRGTGQASFVAFRRKVDAATIGNLREMLAKHPDPAVADDMRHYLMVLLIRSAFQYNEQGVSIGVDRDVLAAAAQKYLDIAPERKQLRRRSIKRWHGLTSHQYPLEEARPVFQILASWKTSSPFYEDEVQSQAALEKIIDEIEAPLAQQARQRAAAPPKPKPLPTD